MKNETLLLTAGAALVGYTWLKAQEPALVPYGSFIRNAPIIGDIYANFKRSRDQYVAAGGFSIQDPMTAFTSITAMVDNFVTGTLGTASTGETFVEYNQRLWDSVTTAVMQPWTLFGG